jgi:deoxyribonuclease-1
MSQTYNIDLSKQERQMMEAWNKLDPIDEWEKEKIKLIHKSHLQIQPSSQANIF